MNNSNSDPNIFANFPTQRFQVILADPPWSYNEKNVQAAPDNPKLHHYSTLPLEVLRQLPIQSITSKDALFWLWSTKDFRCEAESLLRHWGFKYATEYIWIKRSKKGNTYFGCGHYNRICHEYLLLGVKGRLRPLNAKNEPSIFIGRTDRHSKKPHEADALIARNIQQDWTKIELFSRRRMTGWSVWGNEAPNYPPVTSIW